MIRTEGRFDPSTRFVFFLAAGVQDLNQGFDFHSNWLLGVNEVKTSDDFGVLRRAVDSGKRVLLDSGVYPLAAEHSRRNGTTLPESLALPPEKVDGFSRLFDNYVSLIRRIGSDVWGYIEIDFGGKENKIRTRDRLESLGLRPIPVYHPFSDGPEYLETLASQYDRIAVGNMVNLDRPGRRRLLATVWEMKRRFPSLWVHVLGMTPNDWLNSYPIDSGDSSSWLSGIRWGTVKPLIMSSSWGDLPPDFRYELGTDDDSRNRRKALRTGAYSAKMLEMSWSHYLRTIQSFGFDWWPEPLTEKKTL